MKNQNPHLTTFLKKSKRIKAEVEANKKVQATILDAIKNRSTRHVALQPQHDPSKWMHGNSGGYTPIIGGEVALKRRDVEDEVCMAADLYHPDLGISAFAVLLPPCSDGWFYYLIEDFGDLKPLDQCSLLEDYVCEEDFRDVTDMASLAQLLSMEEEELEWYVAPGRRVIHVKSFLYHKRLRLVDPEQTDLIDQRAEFLDKSFGYNICRTLEHFNSRGQSLDGDWDLCFLVNPTKKMLQAYDFHKTHLTWDAQADDTRRERMKELWQILSTPEYTLQCFD